VTSYVTLSGAAWERQKGRISAGGARLAQKGATHARARFVPEIAKVLCTKQLRQQPPPPLLYALVMQIVNLENGRESGTVVSRSHRIGTVKITGRTLESTQNNY